MRVRRFLWGDRYHPLLFGGKAMSGVKASKARDIIKGISNGTEE